jgi:hypothetical protein
VKLLLRILPILIVAGICGIPHSAYADPIDFHMQVLDPNTCTTNPSECTIFDNPFDPGITVSFSKAVCTANNVPNPGQPYGCFKISNQSDLTITSLDLFIPNGKDLDGQPSTCQTNLSPYFSTSSCNLTGGAPDTPEGTYDLLFAIGPSGTGVLPTGTVVLEEIGANPADFNGTGLVGVSPEPSSLLLLSTGAMMAGLFMSKRNLFASGRK